MSKDTIGDDPSASIRRSLRQISVGSYVFQCEVAARLDLHPTDLEAVHRLGLAGPDGLTAGELGRKLRLTSGATTIAVDRLVDRGYVERTRDRADGRRRVVCLLPSAVDSLRAQYRDIDDRITDALIAVEDEDLDAVARFLDLVQG